MSAERKTIFLVDDDMTNLTIGKNALANAYNVFTLNSGARLLKMLEKYIPDLILLDVEMPEMNGYEIIKIIKRMQGLENIPVIFLTAKNDGESELEGLSLGAIDYIIKPFSPPLLIKRIDIHLLVEAQRKELVNYSNNLQEMVDEKTKTVVELKNAILQTIAELVECRDGTTGWHIEHTQAYLRVMLDELARCGLYKEDISDWNMELILQSAQLHDVGKIAIKDSILQKPAKLTEEEFEEIKKHALFGEQIIEKIKKSTADQAFLEYAGILAVTHHEKWDGSGYPRGLAKEQIPLQGRLMAIVDVYDALVSERPYKKPFSHEEAVGIILEGKGRHFDPALVDLFIKAAGSFDEIAKSHASERPDFFSFS